MAPLSCCLTIGMLEEDPEYSRASLREREETDRLHNPKIRRPNHLIIDKDLYSLRENVFISGRARIYEFAFGCHCLVDVLTEFPTFEISLRDRFESTCPGC